MTQYPNPKDKPKKRHPNWGGRRPGAGAPRGNMNALKHGRRSLRMARLGMLFASNPVARAALLAIADRWDRKQMKADEVAAYIFGQVLERGIAVADHRGRKLPDATTDDIVDDPSRLTVLPPVTDRRLIKTDGSETGPSDDASPTQKDTRKKHHRPINQDRRTNPHHRSTSVRENRHD